MVQSCFSSWSRSSFLDPCLETNWSLVVQSQQQWRGAARRGAARQSTVRCGTVAAGQTSPGWAVRFVKKRCCWFRSAARKSWTAEEQTLYRSKERYRSFHSEGPKGQNRKERCSSGLNDPVHTLPTPTHALGSQPSLDHFMVSASRNQSTPNFSDVLFEHLLSAL